MNKKIIGMGLLVWGMLSVSVTVQAQAGFASGDISAILEDNSLHDVTTRYTSVLTYFFPEEATRLGFTSGNHLLNNRSQQTDMQALQALTAVRSSLEQINARGLSASKRAEHTLLVESVNRLIWELNQNRLANNPLYYTQALDAVFDLLLQPVSQDQVRKLRTDLLSRVSSLPTVVKQAKENLTEVPPLLARLAMEKTYYAYLSFDEVDEIISKGAALSNDPRDIDQANQTIAQAKNSIRELFDFFKMLSQEQETAYTPDFRLGAEAYASRLANVYQISPKPGTLENTLSAGFDKAQHVLFDALRPFDLSADSEDVTVVEGLNGIPLQRKADKAVKSSSASTYTPPMANQFYAISSQLVSTFKLGQVLDSFSKQAHALSARLVKKHVLPVNVAFNLLALPAYFAYQQAYLMVPSYDAFWLRLPSGNQLKQEEMLQRDFTEPAYKMLISQELIPGRYYQTHLTKSAVRRLFGNPTLQNGWTLYALQLANQQGYLITDEEQLFLAWNNYLVSLLALVDYRLNTLQYSYEDAIKFLSENNGFPADEATDLVNRVVRAPGEVVSYVMGQDQWQQMAQLYLKKTKDPNRVTDMLLQVGNVSPVDLESELKRVYKK